MVNEKCSCEKEHREHGYWIILGGRTFSHTVRMEDEEFNDGQGEKQRMSDGGWRGSARFMMTASVATRWEIE